MLSSEYQEHLRKEHDGSKWGSTGSRYAGAKFVEILTRRPYIVTVLDYGCGKGTMKPYLQSFFPRLQITEYDPGIPGKDKPPTGRFDLVISSDVLEHVEPLLLGETLKQLDGLTGMVAAHDIACYATGKRFSEGPYAGEDMHLIIEPPSWWRETFRLGSELVEAEYHWQEKASNKGPRPRCLLVMERVQ